MKKIIGSLAILMSVFTASSYAYECNGRHYCSEMTSCEEAQWVLRNCPDPRMDGDNDGWPCEKQFCGYHNAPLNSQNPISSIFTRKAPFNYLASLKTNFLLIESASPDTLIGN